MTRPARPFLAVLLLAVVACDDDPTGPTGPPGGSAGSADQAVRLLRDAFAASDTDAMGRVLHPDFGFELSQTDADRLNLATGATWDRATHLAWCGNLFGGQPGIRTDGVLQNPLDLDFGLTGLWTSEEDAWTEVSSGPQAGTLRRTYRGVWSIQYIGGDFDFVQGAQTFYVRSRDVEFADRTATVYEVAHWFSETATPPAAQKHETISWGLLIAKFRFSGILDTPVGYAADADQVISLLQQAYQTLDGELLGRLLHPTFQFEFDADEAVEFSMSNNFIDRNTFRVWTASMFSGDVGLRADGGEQPGLDVSSGPAGTWTAVDAGWTLVSQGPYLQTLERRFDGPWTASFSDASSATVDGVETFNVVEGVIDTGEALARVHQLRRWAAAPPTSQGTVSWGRLTAWYRVPVPTDR